MSWKRAQANELAKVRSIGAKRQERLLRELQRFRERTARHLLGDVLPLAEHLAAHVREAPGVAEATYAGSLRRMRETIGDLDILAAAADPDPVMSHFLDHEAIAEVLASGSTKSSVLVANNLQVDLLVVPPASYGAALVYFTGSKEHNIELRHRALAMGLSLNEWGLDEVETQVRRPAPSEADVYAALGLPVIPPELRESRGEIAAAADGALPDLIDLSDIRGEFHGHSLWSDGAASVAGMVEAAQAAGYAYIGITDHSGSLQVANGLSPERIRAQRAEIEQARTDAPQIRVLHGSEVEILSDGALDYDDALLADLDVVVASIHSNFNQPRETMTARLIAAIRESARGRDRPPHRAHARLPRRLRVDLDAVLTAAAETGTAMEINASPERLDLDDVMARRARELGVPIAVNSDAHRPESLAYMRYGVATARRAWLTAGDVLNTMTPEALTAWLGQPKPRRWSPHR